MQHPKSLFEMDLIILKLLYKNVDFHKRKRFCFPCIFVYIMDFNNYKIYAIHTVAFQVFILTPFLSLSGVS